MRGIGALELDLVVVKQARGLIFSANINQDVCSLPHLRITAPNHLGISELTSKIAKQGASQHLITMKAAIMGTYPFHLINGINIEGDQGSSSSNISSLMSFFSAAATS